MACANGRIAFALTGIPAEIGTARVLALHEGRAPCLGAAVAGLGPYLIEFQDLPHYADIRRTMAGVRA